MAGDDVGVLVARVVADTEQFRSEMLRVSNQLASNTAKMNSALAKVQESTGSLSKSLGVLTGSLGALGVSFSVGAIAAFALNAIRAADAVGEAAAAANIGAERYQRLQLVFAENGVEAEQFAVAMNKLNSGFGVFIQTGAGPAAKAIKDLGLEAAILSGRIGTQEQFIDAIADSLAKMSDRSRAAAIAVELLGREGAKLAPVLIQGSEALHQAEAAQSGVFSDDQVAKADALERAYRRVASTIGTTLKGAFVDLASALAGTTPEAVARRAEIASLQGQLSGTVPDLESRDSSLAEYSAKRVAMEKRLNELLADEYRALALKKSQLFDDQIQQQSERELAVAQRTAEEAAKVKARSPTYANLLFNTGDKELQELRDGALQEITVTAQKQQVMLSLEQQFQDDLAKERKKATGDLIDNLLAEVDAYKQAEDQKRELAVSTSAAIEYASEALMQASQGHSKKTFEIAKKLAIASTIVNTAQAIMKAYADLGPIGGTIAAVVIAATGLLQLQRIRSTQFESAGGSVSAGASISASSANPSPSSSTASTDLRNNAQKTLTVQFNGPIYGWDVIIGGNSRQAALLGVGG